MRVHNIYPDEPFPDEYDYYSDGTGDADITSWTLEVGMTQAQITAAAPSISGIDPDHGVVGQSGTITVNGTNLIDPITGDASPAIDGAGVTISVNGNPSESQVDLNFTVAQNAPTGNKTLTLSNRFGTDGATFAVVDAQPQIAGISPTTTWYAGHAYTVTITGTNFGANPAVSIDLPTGTIQPTTSNPSNLSVTVSFVVPANSPSGPAPVTVTSRGSSGNGFFAASVPIKKVLKSSTSPDHIFQ